MEPAGSFLDTACLLKDAMLTPLQRREVEALIAAAEQQKKGSNSSFSGDLSFMQQTIHDHWLQIYSTPAQLAKTIVSIDGFCAAFICLLMDDYFNIRYPATPPLAAQHLRKLETETLFAKNAETAIKELCIDRVHVVYRMQHKCVITSLLESDRVHLLEVIKADRCILQEIIGFRKNFAAAQNLLERPMQHFMHECQGSTESTSKSSRLPHLLNFFGFGGGDTSSSSDELVQLIRAAKKED